MPSNEIMTKTLKQEQLDDRCRKSGENPQGQRSGHLYFRQERAAYTLT